MKNLMKVSEVKLVYKTKYDMSERPKINGSQSAYKIFLSVWDMDTIEYRESTKMLYLNRANRVLGISMISEGGTHGTVVDTKLIMQYALKINASSFILAHNHPAGNIIPSDPDNAITKKLKEIGGLLGIQLLDHLIITNRDYFSYADEGEIL